MFTTLITCAVLAAPLVDMLEHQRKMIEAQPPPLSLVDDDTAFAWFTPVDGGYLFSIRHTTTVCCFEDYVSADVAYFWDFTGWQPWDLFENAGMAWRLVDVDPDSYLFPCNGQGWAIGSYGLGQMLDAFEGPVGIFEGPDPLTLVPEGDNCSAQPHPPVLIWSGLTPAITVEVEFWFTGPGDFDGDLRVGVNDFLYVLAHWGLLNVTHFLDVNANWGNTYP